MFSKWLNPITYFNKSVQFDTEPHSPTSFIIQYLALHNSIRCSPAQLTTHNIHDHERSENTLWKPSLYTCKNNVSRRIIVSWEKKSSNKDCIDVYASYRYKGNALHLLHQSTMINLNNLITSFIGRRENTHFPDVSI